MAAAYLLMLLTGESSGNFCGQRRGQGGGGGENFMNNKGQTLETESFSWHEPTRGREGGTSWGHTQTHTHTQVQSPGGGSWVYDRSGYTVSPAGGPEPLGTAGWRGVEQLLRKKIRMCPRGEGDFMEEASSPELSPAAGSS